MHSTAIPCLLTPIRVRGVITRRLYGDTRKETATRRIWQHKFRPRLVVTCSMQRQRDTGTKSFGDLKIRRGLSRASLRAREIQRSTFDHARSCRTPFPADAYWRELGRGVRGEAAPDSDTGALSTFVDAGRLGKGH